MIIDSHCHLMHENNTELLDKIILNASKNEVLKSWRPHVCLIGESYEEYPFNESIEICCKCEILIIIGTAGIINTPVFLAKIARNSGAIVININPKKGALDEVSNYVFRGRASEYFENTIF